MACFLQQQAVLGEAGKVALVVYYVAIDVAVVVVAAAAASS
jgi:hypothetical protein